MEFLISIHYLSFYKWDIINDAIQLLAAIKKSNNEKSIEY